MAVLVLAIAMPGLMLGPAGAAPSKITPEQATATGSYTVHLPYGDDEYKWVITFWNVGALGGPEYAPATVQIWCIKQAGEARFCPATVAKGEAMGASFSGGPDGTLSYAGAQYPLVDGDHFELTSLAGPWQATVDHPEVFSNYKWPATADGIDVGAPAGGEAPVVMGTADNPIAEGQHLRDLSVTKIIGSGSVTWDDITRTFKVKTGPGGKVRLKYLSATLVLAPNSSVTILPIGRSPESNEIGGWLFLNSDSLVYVKDGTKQARQAELKPSVLWEVWNVLKADGADFITLLREGPKPPATTGTVIGVLGTRFYVQSTAEGLSVYLENGQVQLSNEANVEPVVLTAGKVVTMDGTGAFSNPVKYDKKTGTALAREVSTSK